MQVALTDEGLNGLGIHLINETAETVRAKLMLRCFKDGETVVMRREREVELPPRSNQTLRSAELIGSYFDITALTVSACHRSARSWSHSAISRGRSISPSAVRG